MLKTKKAIAFYWVLLGTKIIASDMKKPMKK